MTAAAAAAVTAAHNTRKEGRKKEEAEKYHVRSHGVHVPPFDSPIRFVVHVFSALFISRSSVQPLASTRSTHDPRQEHLLCNGSIVVVEFHWLGVQNVVIR